MPTVFTLTGNLLAERTLEFERWTPGRTQRAQAESFQVGGKGINVSKMLTRLGVANTALCFTGGAAGAECGAWLTRQGFAFRTFATATPTRTGTVVRDRSGGHAETTFLGCDAPADAAALTACAQFLDAQADEQVLALCGSFPGWTEPSAAPLRAALQRWNERGVLVVDTYGPPLVDLAAWPLALLKINADEARTLPAASANQAPADGTADAARNVERLIVTDGPNAIRVRDRDGVAALLHPPPVREVSATGSGDVLLACVLKAWLADRRSLADAVRWAIPFAAANAAHPGIAEFPSPIV